MNVLPKIDAQAVAAEEAWYKDAIIYQLHVKAFADSNDDGIGDFAGLTAHLDYLQDLGVTALWLLPFYPSPQRDDGYDIADYGDLHPMFGTMKDFRRFMTEAKRRGLRVITELVVNHTSDQHPWFKRAQRSPRGSSARDWYVWSDTDQKYLDTRIIFTDTEKSNWAWDPVAGAYYWHRFFSHQPDLNFDNPRVVSAVVQVMKRWLDTGVDGFRLDAIPYLCEREGTNNENLAETHAVIRTLRAELDAYMPGKLLLAEANQWPEDVSAYFGAGDECHMAYHFPLMPRIYMAIAQEDRFPIADILRQTPDIPANCQWAMFLRNHDELTLEMVTDAERDYLWSTYASDPRARINLGIRRRLAPLMDNDRRKIELMNSILMSLPGTPIIYYGDEIGMGDNIYLGDRNGVRTPMQWTPDRNGGFSRADPAKLYAPVIMDAVYGYQAVNVEAQSRSISSLLSWMKRLMAVRKSSKVFGRGTLSFIRPANRRVLAYVRQYGDETILCVANLSRSAQAAELDLSAWRGHVPLEMLGRTKFPMITEAPFVVTLAPYGFFWFQLTRPADGRAESPAIVPELATIVVKDGWHELLAGRSRQIFEHEVLPVFLPGRRWFAEANGQRIDASIEAALTFSEGDLGFLWTLVSAGADQDRNLYSLPLGVTWSRFEQAQQVGAHVIAPVRRVAREGVLIDAATDREFIAMLLRLIHAGKPLDQEDGRLRFRPSPAFAKQAAPQVADVRAASGKQSHTTVFVDSRYAIKFFRRIEPGPNPDLEIGRFLTEVARYQNTPPLLGAVTLQTRQEDFDLAAVHRFVEHQGDGWATTAAYLDRFLEETLLLAPDAAPQPDLHAAFLLRMSQIGRRMAELHAALASGERNSGFVPEPISAEDLAAWRDAALRSAEALFDDLRRRRGQLPESARASIEALLERGDAALALLRGLLPDSVMAAKIRQHGDFHLGQVLIVKDDVFIIDFEGAPGRTLAERRQKAPAARDLAGLIGSIHRAAAASLQRAVRISAEERERLARVLDDWRDQCVKAFLGSYAEHAHPRVWPKVTGTARGLLDFFVLEQALHEIAHELLHRPSWLNVPIAVASRLLARGGP